MSRVYRRNRDFLWREEKGESAEVDSPAGILFHEGEIITLNEVAFDVWKLCDGKSLDGIVQSLLDIYDVDPEILRKDVESFLNDIESRGGLTVGKLGN